MPLATLSERLEIDADYRANWWPNVTRTAVENSHLHRFTLTRAVKHCDWRRLPLHDKPYTFELVLKQLPRGSGDETSP